MCLVAVKLTLNTTLRLFPRLRDLLDNVNHSVNQRAETDPVFMTLTFITKVTELLLRSQPYIS